MFVIYTLILTIITIKIIQNVMFKMKYKYPPGRKGIPFIGDMLEPIGTARVLQNLKLANEYGDMHTTNTLGFRQVVINSMDVLREINIEHSNDFNHRPIWIKALVNLSPGIVFKGVGNFEDNKKFVLRNLKNHGMGKSEMELKILNEIEDLMKFLECNESLDPHDIFDIFSSNMICYLCFGKSWKYDLKDTNKYKDALRQMHKLTKSLLFADLLPVLRWMPWMRSKYQEYERNVNLLRELGRNTINEKKSKGEVTESFDLTDDFLASHNFKPSKEAMKNFEEIAQDMFTAGTLTTSATLTFCVIQLVDKPIIQEKLFMEIEKNLGDNIEPTMADVHKLPYMEGFIHEILRIYPAIPFIPHATYKDTTVRDFHLPANTSVSINSISINNNPKIFDNPKDFNPSRWLDNEGKFKASMVDEIITFGKGKRFCVGKSLARMEVFLMIVKLVQRYKLGVPEGQKSPSCAPVFGPATFVPEEFRLSVTIRQQNE